MTVVLRDYQDDAVAGVREAMAKKFRAVLLVLATGAGKTIIFSYIAKQASERGNNVLILAHRDQLIKQASKKLRDYGVKHGIIMAGFTPDHHARVQVASVQTIVRRLGTLKFKPKIIVIDECLRGDSIIETDVGFIRIDQVLSSGAKMIKSFYNEIICMKPIINFANNGTKKTIIIKHEFGEINCTDNHLIFTDTGWKAAKCLSEKDKILVLADAEISRQQTNTDIHQSGAKDIEFGQINKLTGMQDIYQQLKMLPCANVDAVKRFHLFAEGMTFRKHEQKIQNTTNIFLDTSAGLMNSVTLLPKNRLRQFTERCSAIHQYYILTTKQKIQGYLGITGRHKPNGPFIKQSSLKEWPLKYPQSKIKDTVKSVFAGGHHAIQYLMKFIKDVSLMERKKFLPRGLTSLALSGWHGGIATMDQEIKSRITQCSMLRVSQFTSKTLSLTGLIQDFKELLSALPENTILSDSQKAQAKDFLPKSDLTCPNFLGTKWSRVLGIKEGLSFDVFDVEVADSHCFFADGALVHNCHLSAAQSYRDIVAAFPDAVLLGVTGSPCRLDGKSLGKKSGGLYDYLYKGIGIGELIRRGFLVRPVVYAPAERLDLSGVGSSMGDYKTDQLAAVVDKPKITGSAIEHYNRICRGVPAVAWCVNIAHAQHVCDQFNAAGIAAVMLCGDSSGAERDSALKGLEDGTIQVITFVGILIEGVDCPAICCIILLRPTMSLSSYLQVIGRGLRPYTFADGLVKTCCWVLDHAGLTFKHGFADEDRDWQLDGEPPRKKSRKARDADAEDTIQCVGVGGCYAVFVKQPTCPCCGKAVEVKTRSLDHVDGNLEQITPEMANKMRMDRRREQGSSKSLEELKAYAASKGYSPKWAEHVFNARKKPKEAKRAVITRPREPTMAELSVMTLEQLQQVAIDQSWPVTWPSEFYYENQKLLLEG